MAYKVRFVNYPRQYATLKDELDAAFFEIMSGGDFILRRHLEDFEKAIASFVGSQYAIGVNSGTDALYLSAIAAGFKPGDEVITVGHTFIATVGCIVHSGATPILVDIAEDYNIDAEKIEPAITPNTKAIIPVHLNGHPCNMGKIMELSEKYGLIVIEDAAQSLGAKYKDKTTASFGLAGIFSFYPAKMLGTAGDGGMVCTNDEEFAHRIRALRDNGRTDDVTNIECYGYCSRLDNLHAAILNTKLNHFSEWVSRRREIAALYDEGLSNTPYLKIHPISNEDYFDVYQNYVIRANRRDEFVQYLKNRGVEILVSWPVPLHKQKALNLDHFHLPLTEKISSEVVSLPIYPELADEEVEYVIDCVRDFCLH